MRVTENSNFGVVRESIRKSKERMEHLQEKSSTLKKLNAPSDDPIGASKILEIRTEKVNNEQFQTNAKLAQTFLENSEHTLGELADIVVRAKEIAIGQSSGASSNDNTRLGVAEEITQLYLQAVSAANRRIGDRYIFGGYKTNKAPVDGDGRYLGDQGQMMIEVSKDVFISMNIPGVDAFNSNPKASSDARDLQQRQLQESEKREPKRSPALSQAGEIGSDAMSGESVGENVNVFDELQNLRISLLTGDVQGIQGTLERFDSIHGKLIANRAKIGSRIQGLNNTSLALDRHNLTNAQLSSVLEDADMAQVVSDLAKEETIYRSALASSQKLIQPTLMDFLK